MLSGNRVYPLILVLLIATLFLASCERPIPGSEDGDELISDTSDVDGDESADTESEPETADEESDEGAAADDASATDSVGSTDATDTTDTESGDSAATETDEAAESEDTGDTSSAAEEDAAAETDVEDGADDTETATDTGATEPTKDDAGGGATAVPAQHLVVVGDSLYKIGLQYGISWVAIAAENQLAAPYKILIGQTLALPQPAAPAGEGEGTTTTTETTYIVKAGDNLYRIGLAYGITWVQLAEANGLVNPNQITVGQTLKIPIDTPGPAPIFTHVVKPGETLYLISLQYGVSWTSIAEENQLSSPYVIFVGETLTIPGGG